MTGGRTQRIANLQGLWDLKRKLVWTKETPQLEAKLRNACVPLLLERTTVEGYVRQILSLMDYETRTGKEIKDLQSFLKA